MLWLDVKYISLLSFRLRNFKRKGNDQWNFSCPYCNDSKTDKHKARGYIYQRKGKLRFYCHNCGIPGQDVPKLVKHLDPAMYDQYVKEKLMADPAQKPKSELQEFVDKMKPPVFVTGSPLKHLKKISLFKPDSAVKMWVDGRKIPQEAHYRLFFAKQFKHWVNQHCVPGKFDADSLTRDEPRLVIPFLDAEGHMFGFQGRSFKKNAKVRYITIMMDQHSPKIFGLDQVDVKLPHIYVVEGPLDAIFLPNCVASAGSDLTSNLHRITEDKSKFIIVFDNEPRSPEIVKKMTKAVDNGYNVCIWPDDVEEKDINDMICSKYTQQQVIKIIKDNTFTGLKAKLKFTSWKKC
jgi:transcription elongation factor Elf1